MIFAELSWPEAFLGAVIAITFLIYWGTLVTGRWPWEK
jgi:hypothetical protein